MWMKNKHKDRKTKINIKIDIQVQNHLHLAVSHQLWLHHQIVKEQIVLIVKELWLHHQIVLIVLEVYQPVSNVKELLELGCLAQAKHPPALHSTAQRVSRVSINQTATEAIWAMVGEMKYLLKCRTINLSLDNQLQQDD